MKYGEKRALLLFLVGSTIARLLLLIEYANHNPFYTHPILDSTVYLDWARAILDGRTFFIEEYHHPPGYAFFLAAIFKITGPNYFPVLLLQNLMVTLDAILVFFSARKMFSPRSAWMSLVLFTLCGPFLFYSMKILSETLYSTLLLLSFFYTLRTAETQTLPSFFLAGLFLGAAAEVRGNALICLIPILTYLHFTQGKAGRRALFAFLAGLALLILPVLARNVTVARAWTPVASNWGENFYFANNAQSNGTFTPTEGMGTNLSEQMIAVQKKASSIAGRPLNSIESQRFWFHQGLQFILDHPIAWLHLECVKLLRLFSYRESSSMYFYDMESSYFSSWLRFLFIHYAFILPLFFIGLAFTPASKPVSFLFGVLLFQVLLLFVFWPELRFLLPLFPFLFLVAGNCVELQWSKVRLNERTIPAITGLIFWGIANLIPLAGTGGREAWYANASAALIENEQVAAAAEMAHRSVDLNPRYSPGWVNLGTSAYKMNKIQQARAAWGEALRWNPDDFNTLKNLALSYENENPSRARELWDRCLKAALSSNATPDQIKQIREQQRIMDTNKSE